MPRYVNKHVAVIGGTNGMGLATARLMKDEGATLTCSRARARSRAASHVADGTTTAVNPPAIS